MQNDLSDLKILGLTPKVSASAEVAVGNRVVESANAAVASANATGNSTNAQSQRLVTSAQQWAKKHAC